VVGGRGVLLGGVPGVPPGDVNAALIAIGFGADVIMAGQSMDQLRQASARFGPRLRTVFSARQTVETLCRRADLVIGAVLVPGAAAPKLISAETVKAMKPGAVIVDVSIDQGGMAETSRPRRIRTRPTSSMRWCITASPTCLARRRAARPSRSAT
jgi:alanine dehydrogenase